MSLKFSDIDHTGELSLYSIALLNQQQKLDTLYLRDKGQRKDRGVRKSQEQVG